jgi:hypothetical protein
MDDLIKRLRDWSDGPDTADLCKEAADELEALMHDNDRLRAALNTYVNSETE